MSGHGAVRLSLHTFPLNWGWRNRRWRSWGWGVGGWGSWRRRNWGWVSWGWGKKRNRVSARALIIWFLLKIGWNNMNALQGFKLVVHWATHKKHLNNYWRSDSWTRLNHPCCPIIQISTCILFCWWWEDSWLSGWLLMYIFGTSSNPHSLLPLIKEGPYDLISEQSLITSCSFVHHLAI